MREVSCCLLEIECEARRLVGAGSGERAAQPAGGELVQRHKMQQDLGVRADSERLRPERVGSPRGEAQRKGRSQSRRALRKNGQREGIRVPVSHSPREHHAKQLWYGG